MFVVNHADLMRRDPSPNPEHDIDIRPYSAPRETGHDHPRCAGRDKTLGQRPGRRADPAGRHILPGARQIRRRDPMRRARGRIGQVEHILAIHLIGTQRQRLRLERKRLLRLQPRGLESQGGLERLHSNRVEPPTGRGGPGARVRCESPSRIMCPIDEASQPHAYPPMAIPAR